MPDSLRHHKLLHKPQRRHLQPAIPAHPPWSELAGDMWDLQAAPDVHQLVRRVYCNPETVVDGLWGERRNHGRSYAVLLHDHAVPGAGRY